MFNERLTWTTGAYYFEEVVRSAAPAFFPFAALPVAALGVVVPARLTALDDTKSWVDSWGVYGQGSYRFTDRWSVTLGLRTTYERREFERTTASVFSGLPAAFGGTILVGGINSENPLGRCDNPPGTPPDTCRGRRIDEPHERWSSVSWTAGLEYQATDDLFLFFRAAKGFRSGGFNSRPSVYVALEPYDPEFVTTYELGMKSEWLDNRARANIALYYSKYKELQLSTLFPCASGICANIANRASADISGGEVEVTTRLLPGLDLAGTLGFTWLRYTKGEFASPRRDPQNVPKLEYSLSGRYAFPPFRFGELSIGLDWTWQSDNEGSTLAGLGSTGSGTERCRFCERVRMNANGRLNGRIAFAFEEPDVELAVYGNNLFDREYFRGGTDFGEGTGFGFYTLNWNEGRKFGAEVTYRFGSDSQR
jgi:iron complex outermembrane receptor protein